MTAEDAKTKWCPMARTVEVGDEALYGPFNRYHTGADINPGNENLCLADKCACWVWVRKITIGPDHNEVTTLPDDEWHGRCGLAR